MRKMTLLIGVLGGFCAAAVCCAIDRDARMIDTIGVEAGSPSDSDVVTASLWGENAIAKPYENWALLVGIAAGYESPAHGANNDYRLGGLGVKYYLTPLTGISVIGLYGKYYDMPSDPDFRVLTFKAKHRLISADEPMSPFVTASFSIADGGAYPDPEQWLTCTAGCEFLLTDTLALVMEAGYSDREGGKDGPIGSLAISCYWE